MKMVSLFKHHHVVPNLYDIFSFPFLSIYLFIYLLEERKLIFF